MVLCLQEQLPPPLPPPPYPIFPLSGPSPWGGQTGGILGKGEGGGEGAGQPPLFPPKWHKSSKINRKKLHIAPPFTSITARGPKKKLGNASFGTGPVLLFSTGPVLGQYYFLVLGQYWASTTF